MAEEAQSPLGHWPHNLSSMLASLGCTLGLFNISRFAIFSIQFGANFILQFLFLTLVLGIPLYTFHSSIGQFLASGVMDMWKISPVFQGIGIALLVSQALIGIYSIVGVSWMFIYFRDSFITKQDRYRWAEPFDLYHDSVPSDNGTKLEDTVPDYLSGVVLQRHGLASSENTFGHLKFQVTFNLAVVWMIVFVSLSKGLKSYGKVVYVFSLFPVFGMLILCTKLLGLTPSTGSNQVFPETVWNEFFLNTKCWVAATTEAFFTWGLLGAAMMQISSHNRHKHLLQRDVSLVHMRTYAFLRTGGLQPAFVKTPVRYVPHSTFICGVRVILSSANSNQESGYQVLRFATELVPSTFALLGADQVSPFWAVLFYFVLILFGIAQQLAIWHCVITGIMAINATNLKSWETTITFFSCACGFILGLPMTTELGIFVVYFMDYTVGCGWWLMILYLLEIGAIFVVRGRPYSGENVVTTLLNKGTGCLQVWAAPMLVFTWNVILPVALMVICITVFKQGKFRELYNWTNTGNEYWPLWCREIGCLIQVLPIIAVPLVCIVQTCRYLSDGPPDIFDRIQLLYRPSVERDDSQEQIQPSDASGTAALATTNANVQASTTSEAQFEDPPPKYTPPPSYTTATGARIAKLLRQSFRRSMRRITNVLSDNSEGNASPRTQRGRAPLPPPPDYAAVLVEINQALEHRDQNTLDSMNVTINLDQGSSRTGVDTRVSGNTGQASHTRTLGDNRMSTLTAADVAHILRSSLRRTLRHSIPRGDGNEQLVHGAAPINQDTLRAQTKADEHNTSVI
ncbi:Sodium-dependent nutrient amino acid transporter 1 [Gryllus bimaculatus]|nr:Sodium-dependent nutrient amino acid transporter 1 [Gryllus bimaculatus]